MTVPHETGAGDGSLAKTLLLTELVARLEAASAGSRELDEEIHDLLCASKKRSCIAGLSDAEGGLWMYSFEDHNPSSALRVTTSLDAALALAERVLSGWTAWEIRSRGEKTRFVADISREAGAAEDVETGRGKTPALALCIAILKATGSDQ